MKRSAFLRALAALPFVPSALGAVQEAPEELVATEPEEERDGEWRTCHWCKGRGAFETRSDAVGVIGDGDYLPGPQTTMVHKCEMCGGRGKVFWRRVSGRLEISPELQEKLHQATDPLARRKAFERALQRHVNQHKAAIYEALR